MNNINIDLFISKDFDDRKAVRKVSDNLTVLKCYLSGARKDDGSYEKPWNVEVRVTSKTNLECELAPSKAILVDGFIVPNTYKNKNGFDVTVPVIVARNIKETLRNDQQSAKEDAPSFTNDDGFMTIPDGFGDELPFN